MSDQPMRDQEMERARDIDSKLYVFEITPTVALREAKALAQRTRFKRVADYCREIEAEAQRRIDQDNA